MNPSILTLLGFSAYMLCHSFCPMNMGSMDMSTMDMGAMAMDHSSMPHDMHMQHAQADQQEDTEGCAHCEERAGDEVFLASGTEPVPAPALFAAIDLYTPVTSGDYIAFSLSKSHLAAASPPSLLHTLVGTVILRV